MIFYECDNCHQAFGFESIEDVPTRPSRLEDGVSPFDRVCVCPSCGDYIYKTDTCSICGENAVEPALDVCKCCREEIEKDFNNLLPKYMHKAPHLKAKQVRELILDTLEAE